MATDTPLNDGLVHEDDLPLAWTEVEALPSEQRLASINVSNEALIRACEGLEESHRPSEDSPELAHELARLEAKLNLVLELLGDWLRVQGGQPETRRVRFNAAGLEWWAPAGPESGSLVQLTLHVCPAFPRAMTLYGQVLERAGEGGETRILVSFEGLSDPVLDGLERLIFRRHRREVAQRRGKA
jgi:hypothetical protein